MFMRCTPITRTSVCTGKKWQACQWCCTSAHMCRCRAAPALAVARIKRCGNKLHGESYALFSRKKCSLSCSVQSEIRNEIYLLLIFYTNYGRSKNLFLGAKAQALKIGVLCMCMTDWGESTRFALSNFLYVEPSTSEFSDHPQLPHLETNSLIAIQTNLSKWFTQHPLYLLGISHLALIVMYIYLGGLNFESDFKAVDEPFALVVETDFTLFTTGEAVYAIWTWTVDANGNEHQPTNCSGSVDMGISNKFNNSYTFGFFYNGNYPLDIRFQKNFKHGEATIYTNIPS